MFLEGAASFCVPGWLSWALSFMFMAFICYLLWDFWSRYYRIIQKIYPGLQGVNLLVIPMLRPFVIYSKAARSLPEYWRMWLPILMLLLSSIPIAAVLFLAHDYRCPT